MNLKTPKLFLFLFLTSLNINLEASLQDYIYPNQKPSFSNYGSLGLMQNPNARFHEEGTLGFSYTVMQPYLRGSIVAYPFNWLEASYQYADINNQLYSTVFAFSGNQTFKDKGFDVKIRMLKESELIPQIAVGFRDLAGTGIFSSEYIVGSKLISDVSLPFRGTEIPIGHIDVSLGLGWGKLNGNDVDRNPFTRISEDFRVREGVEGTQGGELSLQTFFSGKMGTFGGIELYLPYLNGARLKLEYDGVNYKEEGFPPVKQNSKVNFGFTYPVTENLHLKIGLVRGNTLNFGFSYSGTYAKKDPFIPKNEPHIPVPNANIEKRVNTDFPEFLYISSLRHLQARNLNVQAATLDEESNSYEVVYAQSRHSSYTRSAGRVARVLDEISPDYIDTFKITNINANMGLHTISLSRDKLVRHNPVPIKNVTIQETEITPIKYDFNNYDFQPKTYFPAHFWSIVPNLRSQIGGPDGFYFGDFRIGLKSELLFQKNISLLSSFSVGVVDNYGELKLASDSVLPHVRSDIVQYLKQSKKIAMERSQLSFFYNPLPEVYVKTSVGYFEPMFGGFGGEVLYRPFYKTWSLGAELWRAKQRAYDQRLKFQDYETTTGYINFNYFEPRSRILLQVKGGRFLAEDSGLHFDVSRRFKSGMRTGIYVAKTDISRAEFGEGSYEKGFYFFIPVEAFFTNYSKGSVGFGLRPVTRDGAQILIHGHDLWGVTDQATSHSILRDWDDLYD